MALDYDSYEGILWVGADDGYGNISAQIVFNGTDKPAVTLVNPSAEMDVTRNNEGFAIAGPEYTVNGLRPVFHFMDGTDTGVLTISYLSCNYNPDDKSRNFRMIKSPAHRIPETRISGYGRYQQFYGAGNSAHRCCRSNRQRGYCKTQ